MLLAVSLLLQQILGSVFDDVVGLSELMIAKDLSIRET